MDDILKMDVRLVERMIASGELKREEYEKYLKSLRNVSAEADNVEASLADRGASLHDDAKKK